MRADILHTEWPRSQDELDQFASKGPGERHAFLLEATLRLASLVRGGLLSEVAVIDGLRRAAMANGMGESRFSEVDEAWESAMTMATPRAIPVASARELRGGPIHKQSRRTSIGTSSPMTNWGSSLETTSIPNRSTGTGPGCIATKKLNLLVGEGKQGKTLMALSIAATTTKGELWCDGSGSAQRGRVIILSAEDDPEDTLAPRLIALGADMSRINIMRAEYRITRPGRESEIHPVSFQDTAYWRAVFRRYPPRVFIVDPLPAYLGRGVNDHKNAEIRSALTPFLGIIREFEIAFTAITHLSKAIDPNKPISHRILGSVAYANLARSIHFVARDRDNPDRRLFMQTDNTLAPSDLPAVAFTLEPRDVTSQKTQRTFQLWVPKFDKETVDVDPGEVLNGMRRSGPGRPATEAAKLAKFLVGFLMDKGPVLLCEIADHAGAAGFLGRQVLKDGRPSLSGFTALYRALELVPNLPSPDDGWMIATPKEDPGLKALNGRVRWQLRRLESPY